MTLFLQAELPLEAYVWIRYQRAFPSGGARVNTNYQPPTTNYQPPTTKYQPPTTNYQLKYAYRIRVTQGDAR